MASTSYAAKGTYTFTLPANIDVTTPLAVDLKGAGGGQGDGVSNANRGAGGAGGRVVGTIDISAMTPGISQITVVVGGAGGTTPNVYTGNEVSIPGGFNGGGSCTVDFGATGGGGGGATDVRIGGTALANRKAVAGGGGASGGGYAGGANGGIGGAGGAATGQAGADSGVHGAGGGGGGTAAAGGAGGAAIGGSSAGAAGTSGTGGNGANATGGLSGSAASGGGGGGGYFGGGGGGGAFASNDPLLNGGGGGGGSNYVGGLLASTSNTQGGGSAQKTDGVAVLTYNLVPNKPALNSPVGSTSVDLTQTITAVWAFSDPDAGATQTKADLQWRIGAGAWTQILAASASAVQQYVFAANYFAAYSGQTIEWQVRTYDEKNAVGPWSDSAYFIPRNPPTAPTFSPVLTGIGSNTPTVGLATPDGALQYQARMVNDVAGAPGATVLADSGSTNGPGGITSASVTLPAFSYVNGTSYHAQIRYAHFSGVWSAWVSSAALVANINAPLQPTAVVTGLADTGSVRVDVTNPGSDPHPPTTNSIYRTDLATGEEIRIATGVAVNGTFTDWTLGFNKQYRYRVVATTATGAFTSSA